MGKYKILAVDDDQIIREMLKITLESGGYQVRIAANGNEAIGALHNENFDLVITDLQMGDPDGFAVLSRAKELNPLTKGIVITGNQDLSSAIKAIRIGVEDYLLKPFSLTELLDCVRKSIAKLALDRKAALKAAEASLSEEQIHAMMLQMSHDIRSALISMGTSLRFLQKRAYGKMAEGVADELDKLSLRCGKLTTMAEEYLDAIFSLKNNNDREEQGLNLLDEIISPVRDELSVDIEENSIAVDNCIDSSVGKTTIQGDKAQLKAVFRNLFKNAIKYGGKGCTLGFDLEDQPDHYRLAVFNNGPAIPEHVQGTLFMQPAKRNRKDHNSDGFGIGLHLAGNIIRKHGGDIRYEKIDAAPHFVFTLPKDKTMQSTAPEFEFPEKHNPSINFLRW